MKAALSVRIEAARAASRINPHGRPGSFFFFGGILVFIPSETCRYCGSADKTCKIRCTFRESFRRFWYAVRVAVFGP